MPLTNDSAIAFWQVQSPFTTNQELRGLKNLVPGYYSFQICIGMLMDPGIVGGWNAAAMKFAHNHKAVISGNEYELLAGIQMNGYRAVMNAEIKVNFSATDNAIVYMIDPEASNNYVSVGSMVATRLQ